MRRLLAFAGVVGPVGLGRFLGGEAGTPPQGHALAERAESPGVPAPVGAGPAWSRPGSRIFAPSSRQITRYA